MTTRARVQANPTTLILSDFMGELSSRIAAWSSVGFGKSERKELPAKAAVSGQYQGKALDGRSAMEGSHRMQCRITLPFNSGDVKSRLFCIACDENLPWRCDRLTPSLDIVR